MKKIALVLVLLFLLITRTAFSKENLIYEINLNNKLNDEGKVELVLKSDFKGDIKTVEENKNSVYFDIENAKLSDDFKTNFNGKNSAVSIVSQQIGSKVRIYVKGENPNMFTASLFSEKNIKNTMYTPWYPLLAFMILVSLVAIKVCSATIKMSSKRANIQKRNSMNDAARLNRKLYGTKTAPVLVSKSTNPIRPNVYVDFNRAKDKQNIKLAI